MLATGAGRNVRSGGAGNDRVATSIGFELMIGGDGATDLTAADFIL